MELTIENLRTLAQGGQIFLTAHSQARLYERGILLADIRQAIQSGKIIEYRPDDYRCPSCLVLGVNLAGRWLHVVCGIRCVPVVEIWPVGCTLCAVSMRVHCGFSQPTGQISTTGTQRIPNERRKGNKL